MAPQAFHGSDLEEIEKAYGIKKDKIISFSANVNPLGVSQRFLSAVREGAEALKSYPDRGYESLREAISAYCGADKEHILVGSGATELISNVIGTVAPQKVLMIEPTYSEYSRKLTGLGAEIDSYMLKAENEFKPDARDIIKHLKKGYDLVMICNPNNPTGTALTAEEIGVIAESTNAVVLVDETYVEFTHAVDKISVVKIAKNHENLVVLRGTSKFFATPGLRLGYMVCSGADLRKSIAEKADPWSVNSIAAVCGGMMFSDEAYIEVTRSFIAGEMDRVLKRLSALPLHIVEPAANFVLLRIEDNNINSAKVFEYCIRKGLMIRDCSSFNGLNDRYIRLCLSSPENNDKLIDTLAEIFEV